MKCCASTGREFRVRIANGKNSMGSEATQVATINVNVQFIGEVTQIAGVAALVAGVVLSPRRESVFRVRTSTEWRGGGSPATRPSRSSRRV